MANNDDDYTTKQRATVSISLEAAKLIREHFLPKKPERLSWERYPREAREAIEYFMYELARVDEQERRELAEEVQRYNDEQNAARTAERARRYHERKGSK